MKIFISWSGKKSMAVAEYFSEWLKKVIQTSDIWVSTQVDKGQKWNSIIEKELELTDFGIICLTESNLNSNWILFEAGALSKSKDAQICTFLLDIEPKDIHPPLSQFQHTIFKKEDLRKLIHTINKKKSSNDLGKISITDLDDIFDAFYPRLEKKLTEIKNQKNLTSSIKDNETMLYEILSTTKSTQKLILSKNTKTELRGVLVIEGVDSLGSVKNITDIIVKQKIMNLKSISAESMDGNLYVEIKLVMDYVSYIEVFVELNALENINSVILKDY